MPSVHESPAGAPPMKVVVFGNDYQQASCHEISRLFSHLRSLGAATAVEAAFLRYLSGIGVDTAGLRRVASSRVVEADLALSLGGDGTFLTTVMWLAQTNIPVMGINTGHLGYLTACNLAEAPEAIDDWRAGRCRVELRSMLSVKCKGVKIKHPLALNDIAILRQDTSSMIELETTLDGCPLTTYKGDGLVVCTPTGSTAYNLSAGGPILEPATRCMAISPLSPHSLTMRPLVVPDTATISIVVHTRADFFQVSVDGEAFVCPSGTRVDISCAPTAVRVVQRAGHNFAATLRGKLHWGE